MEVTGDRKGQRYAVTLRIFELPIGRERDRNARAREVASRADPFVAAIRGSYRSSYHSKSIDRSSCTIPFPAAWIRLSQT